MMQAREYDDPAPHSAFGMFLPQTVGRFSGKERDAESGLDYFGARYFSAAQGRFTSPDTAGPDLTNPQTLNKYRYALNNPLRYVDRNGLYEEDVHRDVTMALALAAGISQPVAARIGRADQWVDDNPATNPTQVFGGEEPRALFHFTTAQRRGEMYAAFDRSGSPEDFGTFLHAEQDSYSHAGYGPATGHLLAGHAPDKTYNDPEKADRMALDTYTRLTSAAPKLPGATYKPLSWNVVSPLAQAFDRARSPEEKARILQQLQNLARQNIQTQEQARRAKEEEDKRKKDKNY